SIANAIQTINAGDVVKIWVSGSSIHISVNGSECAGSPWTDTNIAGSSTSPGFMMSDFAKPILDDCTVDNFSGTPATTYTFTGPSGGTVNVGSTNFTAPPNGSSTATVPPATNGAGSFTPSSVTFSGTGAKTFTYTPTSTSGSPHTLSVTNNG